MQGKFFFPYKYIHQEGDYAYSDSRGEDIRMVARGADFDSKKLEDLKEDCRKLNLKVSGRKKDVIKRLIGERGGKALARS